MSDKREDFLARRHRAYTAARGELSTFQSECEGLIDELVVHTPSVFSCHSAQLIDKLNLFAARVRDEKTLIGALDAHNRWVNFWAAVARDTLNDNGAFSYAGNSRTLYSMGKCAEEVIAPLSRAAQLTATKKSPAAPMEVYQIDGVEVSAEEEAFFAEFFRQMQVLADACEKEQLRFYAPPLYAPLRGVCYTRKHRRGFMRSSSQVGGEAVAFAESHNFSRALFSPQQKILSAVYALASIGAKQRDTIASKLYLAEDNDLFEVFSYLVGGLCGYGEFEYEELTVEEKSNLLATAFLLAPVCIKKKDGKRGDGDDSLKGSSVPVHTDNDLIDKTARVFSLCADSGSRANVARLNDFADFIYSRERSDRCEDSGKPRDEYSHAAILSRWQDFLTAVESNVSPTGSWPSLPASLFIDVVYPGLADIEPRIGEVGFNDSLDDSLDDDPLNSHKNEWERTRHLFDLGIKQFSGIDAQRFIFDHARGFIFGQRTKEMRLFFDRLSSGPWGLSELALDYAPVLIAKHATKCGDFSPEKDYIELEEERGEFVDPTIPPYRFGFDPGQVAYFLGEFLVPLLDDQHCR